MPIIKHIPIYAAPKRLELDFGTFFSDYCQNIVDEIRLQYQPLIDNASTPAQAMAISRAMGMR